MECNQKAGARLSIIDPGTGNPATHVFIAETPDLLQEWLSVLLQHIYDQSEWLMGIGVHIWAKEIGMLLFIEYL